MPKILIPETYSPAKKRIVLAFISVTKRHRIAGSELVRHVAKKVCAKLDKNGSHSHIRRVICEYQNLVRAD